MTIPKLLFFEELFYNLVFYHACVDVAIGLS